MGQPVTPPDNQPQSQIFQRGLLALAGILGIGGMILFAYGLIALFFSPPIPKLHMRAHASVSAVNTSGEEVVEDSVSISTAEPVSSKYPQARNARRLGAFEPEGSTQLFFSIRWDFKHDTVARFGDAVIVMMGCEGLRADKTAPALKERGAGPIVGWFNLVTADHMDRAILYMLKQWFVYDRSLTRAVIDTRREIGPDPYFTQTELKILQ